MRAAAETYVMPGGETDATASRPACLTSYLEIFFTKDGGRRKNLATNTLALRNAPLSSTTLP